MFNNLTNEIKLLLIFHSLSKYDLKQISCLIENLPNILIDLTKKLHLHGIFLFEKTSFTPPKLEVELHKQPPLHASDSEELVEQFRCVLGY